MVDLKALRRVLNNAEGWNECPTPEDDEAVRKVRAYLEHEESIFKANVEYMAILEDYTKEW